MSGPIIKLPCAIGDHTYYKTYFNKGMVKGRVTAFTVDSGGLLLHIKTGDGRIVKKTEKEIVKYEQVAK